MGKFEKLVVLVVLFLVTLILVVSLNTEEPTTLAQASLGGTSEVVMDVTPEPMPEPVVLWEPVEPIAEEPLGEPAPEAVEEEVFDPSTALLSSHVQVELEGGEERVPVELVDLVALPEGSILLQRAELTETLDPHTFKAAVEAGETYKSIALKFYGDESYAGMIRQANDDPMTAPEMEMVFLPAFDMRLQRRGRVGGKSHLVTTGDTFTGIALEYYGDASKWRRIFDANEDKVSSETGLRPGMTLVIP